MKILLKLLVTLSLIIPLSAQIDIQISDNPNADELTELFRQTTAGKLDPFKVLPLVIEKGNRVLGALNQFLYAEPEPDDTIIIDGENIAVEKVVPNKAYALYALDGISTPAAEQMIINAVRRHPDVEIRGTALKILAMNRYYRAAEDDNTPDKEILHVLINNADDTTYVQSLGERIGKIVREGIKNWTDKDYGDVPTGNMEDIVNPGFDVVEYRENMWQQNSNRVNWDKERKKFVMNY